MSNPYAPPGLMPAPAVRRIGGGPPLPGGSRLTAGYPQVRTARLDRALAWYHARWPEPAAGPEELPLTIDCASAGAAYPALGDDETYALHVDGSGVHIAAPEEWGVLRALASLTQLLDGVPVPAQQIEDRPNLAWRGLMLDVARHFLPLAALLRTLDTMALVKLNVLHLHLSDDQGFRFPSERYPALPSAERYSADDIRRLVEHAADRGIRVVPELDVPGHTACWLTAYPQWGNRPARPTRRFGVHKECLDPTRQEVLDALAGLFEEVAQCFPDAYLHMGGDEVHPAWWSGDPSIRRFMAAHDFADVADLQAHFTRSMADLVTGLGKTPIAWDEVLHPQLPSPVAVQAWRGVTARDRALAGGHDCVMSAPYYLDLFFPVDVHCGFDPQAAEAVLVEREDALLEDPRLRHVAGGMAWTRQWREQVPALGVGGGVLLGAEACLWAELVETRLLDVRLWSRMPALAERFWSASAVAAEDVYERLSRLLTRLPAWTGVDLAGDVDRMCAAAGVGAGWQPLIAMLEPVKWYARLLGEQALTARLEGREMPQSRPYRVDTPLDRVVDALPPESLAARQVLRLTREEAAGDLEARARLRTLAQIWRDLPASAGPAELEPAAAMLARLGGAVLDVLDGANSQQDAERVAAEAANPLGEYLLAPAPMVAAWLADRQDASPASGPHDA